VTVHLVNPSHVSFGIGVITPRWLYVLAAATPESYGVPAIVDETLETIDFEHSGTRATCTLTAGGRRVLTLSVPRDGSRTLPENAMTTYTMMDGRALHSLRRIRAWRRIRISSKAV